ncbi:MAG: hypothetical protein JNK05_06950 [Myxococcales bacterium]|nr:hypothetical protein [Myxococcales bacterium]
MTSRNVRWIASIALSLLALVARPASAIVRLGAEEPVDTTVTDGLEGFWSADRPALLQDTFAVPSRGGALLLHRSNFSSFASQRLSGTFEFSPPRALGAALGGARVVLAVPDNDGMFVVAERFALSSARDVYAWRLDADGVPRSVEPSLLVRISTDAVDRLAAACTIDACTLVAFVAPSQLQIVRVPSSGAATTRVLAVTAPTYARPAVATNGTSLLVSLVRDADRVQIIPLSATGEPGAARLLDAYTSNTPRIAHDGRSFVLQYVRRTSGTPSTAWEVRARRLESDASDLAPSRDVLLGTVATFSTHSMFRDGDALRWVLDPATMTGPVRTATLDHADTLSPVTPWLERSTLQLEYSDRVLPATAGPLVFQRRVLSVADSLARVEIPTIAQVYAPARARTHVAPGEPARQRSPRLVRQGSNVRVVWAESRADIGELYTRSLLADATLSPTERLPVSTNTLRVGCFDALAAGDELFLSWQNLLGTLGAPGAARVRRSGSVLRYSEPQTHTVYTSTDQCPQFFSVDGRLQWVQHASRSISLGADVGSMYFDDRGTLFGEEGYYPAYVTGFVSGSELEVHWSRGVMPRRARVPTTIARPSIAIEPSTVTFGDPLRIIEHSDRTRLAVWRDGEWRAQRFDNSGPIDASRAIDAAPIMLATPPNTLANLDRSSLELASDRSSFYVALVVATGMSSPSKTLEVLRIAKDGPPSIERARVLPATAEIEGFSMLVEAEGRVRVAYGRRDDTLGVSRIFTREVSFDDALVEQGRTCARNAQCRSGACVDGVCCESACPSVGATCGVCAAARGAPSDGVCAQVSCAPIVPRDAAVDAAVDASELEDVVVEDVVTADSRAADVPADRGVVDASVDVASRDASTVEPHLGGGCQCTTPATHPRSRSVLSLFVLGLATATLASRKRR